MYKDFSVNSHKGPYTVRFVQDGFSEMVDSIAKDTHVLMDKNIYELYKDRLERYLNLKSLLIIDATEENKSLERMPFYVEHLVQHKLRRNHQLLAIGGGIIQDITCFLAANMLRGVTWEFIPTTLLAQADSCIGSKSSINCAESKNILGTFTPPKSIIINLDFLKTLNIDAVRSGVGEMLKVHAIAGVSSFKNIAADYSKLFVDDKMMQEYIYHSLLIKKDIIEEDEFDLDLRQVMNYGHTIGHAIESATNFAIPHGIAVTMGMDLANYFSLQQGLSLQAYFDGMHTVLYKNYREFLDVHIPLDKFFIALLKDKKNTGINSVRLILPNMQNCITKSEFPLDEEFKLICKNYFEMIKIKEAV